jgi:carboxyl-terminal processing protease
MTERYFKSFLGLAAGFFLLVQAAAVATPTEAAAPLKPVTPGPADGQIAFATAWLLEHYHYSQQAFDSAVSAKLLDHYIEAYDPQHLHFVKADVDEFEKYRTNLNKLTLLGKAPRVADVTPACEIFNRYLERLRQRVDFVQELLKTEDFKFDADERIVISRKDSPYPKDLDEAKKLWRERLRYEYLQERLGKLDARKKTESAKTETREKKVTTPRKTEREEIVDTLSHRYQRTLRTFTDFDNDDVLQVYLTTLARVYDPHSDYMGHAQLEQFAIGMNLSLFGIGAELRSEDGYCTINRLLPGGPAIKSKKIKEKDKIVAVAQSNQPPVDVVDMNLSKAVQLIRGPKGTEVRLTILPGGDASERKVVSLIRDEIKLEDQEAKAKVIELPDRSGEMVRLGVIDLPSFYATFEPGSAGRRSVQKSTTADVSRLITRLKKEQVKGLILDLRRNGGGSLEEAIRLTGLFIKEGPIVQVRNPGAQGQVEVDDDPDPSIQYEGPLVVLTSRLSASASEILAGALQDYGRALIVGDSSTHGKGTVQSVNPLRTVLPQNPAATNDPGALKVTIKKFYRASGASTQLRGVTPDIVLPSLLSESKDFGESAMDNALPWDTIKSAQFEKWNRVQPYLPNLTRNSNERIASDPEWKYIREDIELFKKQQADKTISLNEKQRLAEKDEIEARQKAREKERLARKEGPEKIYELTLKELDAPLVLKTNTLAKADSKAAGGSAGTNAALVSASDPAPELGVDEDRVDDEKHTPPDAVLKEAEQILVDYLGLLVKGDFQTVRKE